MVSVSYSCQFSSSLTIECPSGGYRKEYLKGSKSVGMALEDTWLLQ